MILKFESRVTTNFWCGFNCQILQNQNLGGKAILHQSECHCDKLQTNSEKKIDICFILSTIGPQNYLRNDIILYQNWFVIVRVRWFRNNRQVRLKLFYIKIDVVGTFALKSTSLDKRLVFFFLEVS